MASIGESYSFSESYIENFRVKVSLSGVALQGAIVTIQSPSWGTFQSTTDANGLSESVFIGSSENLTITVVKEDQEIDESVVESFVFDSSLQQLSISVVLPPQLLEASNIHFIRWHQATQLFVQSDQIGTKDEGGVFTAYEDGVCSLFLKSSDVQNNYLMNHLKYKPPFFEGDSISLILNFPVDFGGDDFNDVVVGIMDATGMVVNNTLTITQTTCNASNYYHLEFEYPSVNRHELYFIIYNSTKEAVYYVSNPFRALSDEVKENYPFVSFRNQSDLFGHPYECLTDVRNTMRLDLNGIEDQPEINLEQYRSASSGKQRNVRTETSYVVSVEAYFFDKAANKAMVPFSVHDDILINNRSYEVKTAYSIENNKINSVKKGVIELFDQELSTINK